MSAAAHETAAWPRPKEKGVDQENPATPEEHTHLHDTSVAASAAMPSIAGRAPKHVTPGTKAAAVLKMFLERGERGVNCFEAVRWAHDFVLRTSVSNLTHQYGLAFDRRFERVFGHGGTLVDCVRYQIAPGSRQSARELLGLPKDTSHEHDMLDARL